MPKRLFIICAGFGLAVPALAFGSQSGGIGGVSAAFNVSPLRIEFDSGETSEQMQVRNESDNIMAVQVRVFAWTQVDGEDQYGPTDDIIASPSIIRINPADAQTFRLLRKRASTIDGEARYRVVIDQLPGSEAGQAAAATTRLRLTIPLFAARDRASPARLDWSVQDGRLIAHNMGGQTVRLGNLMLSDQAGGWTLDPASTRYLLGGSSISWKLKTTPDCTDKITITKNIKLAGTIDEKKFDAKPALICT